MTPFLRDRIRLQAEQDQDRENCKLWWAEASLADKMFIWDVIQRDYSDREDGNAMEIVSRFAQLAFTQMALDDCATTSP